MRSHHHDKQEIFFDWIVLILAMAGLAINLLLLSRHFPGSGAGIAGCGGGDCEEVLASRWAYVFRLPVTIFGTLAYTALILSLRRRFETWQLPALGLITGGACWFLFVQSVLLDRYCPWCLAAHSLAISLCAFGLLRMLLRRENLGSFARLGAWALSGLFAIGLAQIYGPEPVTHRIDDQPVGAGDAAAASQGSAQDGDAAVRDLTQLPLLGPPSATHVMVEYFDYQCAACRTMADHLAALMARHPDTLAVRLAPVPMDNLCNSHVPPGARRPGSCELAKIALAVWYHTPEHFPAFHRELLAAPTPATARRAAHALMEPDELAERIAERRVMDVIRGNVADWRRFSRHNEKLPKLLVRPGRMLHGLPSGEESFIRVMEEELGL